MPKSYAPIPGERASAGYIALDIYRPGEWSADKDERWKVFVGGCGVGSAETEEAAEELLLRRARERCEYLATYAEATARHYRRQLARLTDEGLVASD